MPKCETQGHFSRVCKSVRKASRNTQSSATAATSTIATATTLATTSVNNATSRILFNGKSVTALIDSGSCDSFVSENLAAKLGLHVIPSESLVAMATSSLTVTIKGYVLADITVQSSVYKHVRFLVLRDLCFDVILGRDFMKQHESVEILFGGKSPRLTI